jgi:hypothetical protein
MSVSGVTGGGAGAVGVAAGRTAAVAGSFEALLQALKAGDIGSARSAYARLSASLESDRGTGGVGRESPLGRLLGRVGDALQAGDLSAARAAADSFRAGTPETTVAADGREARLPLQTAFVALLTALDAGDVPAACEACVDLQRLTASVASGSSSSADARAAALPSPGAPQPANHGADPLRALIGTIADALAARDVAAARLAVAQFFDQTAQTGRGRSLTATLDEWVQARAAEQAAAAALPAAAAQARGVRRSAAASERRSRRLGLRIGGLALFLFVLVFGPDRCHAGMMVEEIVHPAPCIEALGCRIQPPIDHGSVC